MGSVSWVCQICRTPTAAPTSGMRNRYIDMSEFTATSMRNYDPGVKAYQWIAGFKRGGTRRVAVRGEARGLVEVRRKMTLIAPRPHARQPPPGHLGFRGRGWRPRRHRGGLQGQRQWTDHFRAARRSGDHPQHKRWLDRRSPAFRRPTENDSATVPRCCVRLLTNTPQIFSDVRAYWSPGPSRRPPVEARAALPPVCSTCGNSGSTTLDAGKAVLTRRQAVIKPWLG